MRPEKLPLRLRRRITPGRGDFRLALLVDTNQLDGSQIIDRQSMLAAQGAVTAAGDMPAYADRITGARWQSDAEPLIQLRVDVPQRAATFHAVVVLALSR